MNPAAQLSPRSPRESSLPPRVTFHDLHPSPSDLRAEVVEGLSEPQKRLSPKLFYDRPGSLLFDAITALPEYYPTRTEIGILRRYGEEMARRIGSGQVLVELGSGSSLKIRILLEALRPAVYMPVDISRDHLLESAASLAAHFPDLFIEAVCADYSVPFELPLGADSGDLAGFFPGSSIGNFEPSEARALLGRIRGLLGPGSSLSIGVDLIKDRSLLERAYDDAQGVTARFNLNLLARINRELKGDFDLGGFVHRAFYNPRPDPTDPDGPGRIEMHLKSLRDQRARIGDHIFRFRQGETIHTESSYKYELAGFARLAEEAGFATEQVWTDRQRLFSVHCLRADG